MELARSILANPATAREMAYGVAGGRLAPSGLGATPAATNILQYYAFCGNTVDVAGEILDISTPKTFDITSVNLCDGNGDDSLAVCPAVAQNLYAYIANSQAVYRPGQLLLSSTAPDRGGTYLDGTPYLSTSGNGANLRYVGSVRTTATPQFVDTPAQRFVSNYYNRVLRSLTQTPSYTDNNAQTTYTLNNAAWAISVANATVSMLLEEDASNDHPRMDYFGTATFVIVSQGAAIGAVGVGINSTTNPYRAGLVASGAANVNVTIPFSGSLVPGSAGTVTVNALAFTNSVVMTFAADLARNGATVDPAATSLNGFVIS